jgi:hypothetical protein
MTALVANRCTRTAASSPRAGVMLVTGTTTTPLLIGAPVVAVPAQP